MDKSIMWQYIAEETESLQRLLNSKQTEEYAREEASDIDAIYFAAHGSSYNAAVSVSGFIAANAGIRTYAYTPGNFINCCKSFSLENMDRTLLVVISQTGTSTGVIDALEHGKKFGCRSLSLTDTAGSPIEEKADKTLYIMCGREDSNAKTKGYSGTLLLLMQLGIALGEAKGRLTPAKAGELRSELTAMAAAVPSVTDKTKLWAQAHSFGKELDNLYVLGSGMNFGTGQEGQLKHMETCCIPTMFNDMGEFSHGMHRSITQKSCVLLIRTKDMDDELTLHSFEYLKKLSDNVWMIDCTGESLVDGNIISVPCFKNTQSVLLTTLVIQILSVYAPEYNGCDPNRDAHNDFTDFVGTRVGQKGFKQVL